MHIVQPDVDRYLDRLAGHGDPVLEEMERVASERGFPIVGPQVGRLLFVLATAAGARRVLELGSGFGYSAHWFARAVGPQGSVVLTEGSRARAGEAREYLSRSGLLDRCRIEVGDALEIAGRLDGPFDIVFNDIDKHRYPEVLDRVTGRLRTGGLFLSDNMLWFGRVLDERGADADTRGVLELTRKLYASGDYDVALAPVRDGLTLAIRRG